MWECRRHPHGLSVGRWRSGLVADFSRGAAGVAARCASRRTLFVEYMLLDDAPVGTAIAPRPHAGTPAAAVEDFLPAHEIVLVQTTAQAHFGAYVGGQLGFQERADFGAKGFFFGGVIEIHEKFLIRS